MAASPALPLPPTDVLSMPVRAGAAGVSNVAPPLLIDADGPEALLGVLR
jgi:hypothetical protein